MRKIDDILNEALSADERAVLERLGPEPGLFGSARGLFTGRLGWVNAVLMVVQGAAFIAGAYAAWQFFEARETVTQLRWGLPAMTLLLLSAMLKSMMWPAVHADRVIRELKRLEVQLHDERGRRQ
jgi:hypothetical protein